MEKAAYINSVSAYLPNSPIANEATLSTHLFNIITH